MGRMVKCKRCGKKIDQSTAFKVLKWKKDGSPAPSEWYCNEDEYVEVVNAKMKRELCLKELELVFGVGWSYSTALGQMKDIISNYGYETLYYYLLQDGERICNTLRNKKFETNFGKLRYFLAILRNNLPDFAPPKEDNRTVKPDEIVEITYKPKTKRRSLDDIEDDLDE